jgi:menaquinone-dependent protoporphyrinogen oxidase
MSDFLIAYASTHGHTAKIAARIADVLRAAGHDADVRDDVAASDPLPCDYDAVIAGASIHNGHHQADLVAWALRHGTSLNIVPSAFFSVCLAAAEDSREARAITRGYLDEFEDATGWLPRRRRTFAGALQYREYEFVTRLVMRVLMQRGDHPTDISRDFDYTDWDAVEAFAHDCVALVAPIALSRP